MKIEVEMDLPYFASNFACQEAADVLFEVNNKDLIQDLEECLYEFFPFGVSDERLQEYLLNRDEVANDLGFETWDHLENTFEYIANRVRKEINDHDLELFESTEESDLEDYLEDNYTIDNLKDIKEIILDIKLKISDID